MGDFDDFLEQYHLALREIINGNPGLYKQLYSRRDDVTLANPFAPFGPVSRGRAQVEETLERAASNYTGGEPTDFDCVARSVTSELAYIVEVETFEAKIGGRADMVPATLRVTSVFRLEEGEWKVVHRHADPITSARSAESILPEQT